MRMSGRKCGNCVFHEYGKCLRYPPDAGESALGVKTVVAEDDWCGEHLTEAERGVSGVGGISIV